MPFQPDQGSIVGALTDQTGVSRITVPKVIKDAIADFLITVPAVFIGLNIANLEGALVVPTAVGLGIADAAIRVVYRTVLRWATTT